MVVVGDGRWYPLFYACGRADDATAHESATDVHDGDPGDELG